MRRENSALSGWHPEDVKAAIRKKGITLRDLSVRNGYSESYLRNALMRPLFDAEQIIARFIGVPAQVIWPDRYDIHGQPDRQGWSKARQAHFRSLQRKAARG